MTHKNNTLVLINNENIPPIKWKLWRIESIIVGQDGVGRVLEIRTDSRL